MQGNPSATPGIKGLAIAGLVDDLGRLRRNGVVGEDELAKYLEPTDLMLLEREFDPFQWYPIETYERLTTALLELSGGEGLDWLRARGAAAAQRLLEKGLYQQLSALKDQKSAWSVKNYASRIRLITTLHSSILNFTCWQVEDDPDHPNRVRIVVTGASDLPDALQHVTEGFINACAEEAGGGARWLSDRPERDRIVFRMDRDFSS